MEIKLIKEIELTGGEWYKVLVGNSCHCATRDEAEARAKYETIIANADKAKEIVLESQNI